jgi:ATPase family protein associated with various cellular activities (AAA)
VSAPAPAALFHPGIEPADPLVRLWLARVTLRLRREIAWCWHQRRIAVDGQAKPAPGALPPFTDAAQDSMDLLRFRADKQAFFAGDVTARYLTECIGRPDVPGAAAASGRWRKLAEALALDDAAQFVLACALAARADAALGAVAAAALNDPYKPYLTLALAQRLWDEPLAVVRCADPTHPLYRYGLLKAPAARDTAEWSAPLEMPAPVAQALLADPRHDALPAGLRLLSAPAAAEASAQVKALARWLQATPVGSMQVVPVLTVRGADTAAWVGALAAAAQMRVALLNEEVTPEHASLPGLACAAWLHGVGVLAPNHWAQPGSAGHAENWIAPLAGIPVRWFLPVADGGATREFSAALLAPAFHVPALGMAERARRLSSAAAAGAGNATRAAVVAQAMEVARRFRLQEQSLARVERVLREESALTRSELFELALAEAALDLQGQAQAVTPRFALRELVLPPRQRRQLEAIVTAMRTLGRVHYEWGCARAWNEGGLAVMFCGPPGTGKTMAAEALAAELELPMYRIDLSQVVNKYIGETEKNLRRIFDAGEAADCLLFFDEADALFGKRTEVRDAHDRFANIEISYLLERMERFKGLAVLATNRRKDLDEAFARRLRYVIEFPVPGAAERALIWRQVFPAPVDVDSIDFDFLARRFEVAGGSIRSAAFNACLQAAAREGAARVEMCEVLVALKRELEKSGREVAAEQFGAYAPALGAHA